MVSKTDIRTSHLKLADTLVNALAYHHIGHIGRLANSLFQLLFTESMVVGKTQKFPSTENTLNSHRYQPPSVYGPVFCRIG